VDIFGLLALALAVDEFAEIEGRRGPLRSPSMSAARRASIFVFSGMSASAHLRMHGYQIRQQPDISAVHCPANMVVP
jgi:hypothetical protein